MRHFRKFKYVKLHPTKNRKSDKPSKRGGANASTGSSGRERRETRINRANSAVGMEAENSAIPLTAALSASPHPGKAGGLTRNPRKLAPEKSSKRKKLQMLKSKLQCQTDERNRMESLENFFLITFHYDNQVLVFKLVLSTCSFCNMMIN